MNDILKLVDIDKDDKLDDWEWAKVASALRTAGHINTAQARSMRKFWKNWMNDKDGEWKETKVSEFST